MPFPLHKLPKQPKDRFEVYRLFNGLSEEGKEGLAAGRTRVPLVKTFLLEHVAARGGATPKPLTDIWDRLAAQPTRVDESLSSVSGVADDPDTGQPRQMVTGYVEQFNERFFAYYTVEDSQKARSRVRRWVQRSPDLDFAWFSSPLLKSLWDQDVSQRGDRRFGRLVFRHESLYELPEDSADCATEESEDTAGETKDDDESPGLERRRFRSVMGDCIGRIRDSLEALRRSYSPLHALYALRIPSHLPRGGHDLFQDGQLTNHTESFEDHRNTARYLWRIYNAVLDDTEESAWGSAGTDKVVGWRGVPLIVNFDEPLPKATFDNWVKKAFHKLNVFQLWGEPLRLGPTKVHVYGADRHLWQPLNLELTERRLVAILPRGTCGNTFHRLVANLQHYVSPKIDAWIGDRRFDGFLQNMTLDNFSRED